MTDAVNVTTSAAPTAIINFRERTSSGLVWSVVSQVSSQAALLLTTVILARLLTPHDFGIVATSMIFVNFAWVIFGLGFGAALIQRPEITEDHLCSIYWVNIAIGALLSASFLVAAPILARVYGEPELNGMIRIISVIFVITSLGSVHSNLLERQLEFRALAKVDVASSWIGALAAIVLARRGWGAWSMGGSMVVISLAGLGASWAFCPWRPRAVFSPRAVKELAGLGSRNAFGQVAEYWVRNVDNLLVGYRLGQAPLGVYTRAYAVMLFPWSRVTSIVARVMLPAFSLIQGDSGRLRSLFLRVARMIALATFPMMLGVFATAPDFTATVFGPQWGEMVPILRILALVGMINSITSLFNSVYLSCNRMDLYLRVSLPIQAFQILGIVVGLKGGIVGVAAGYAATTLATAPIRCYYGGSLLEMGMLKLFSDLRGVLLASVVMAVVVAALGRVVGAGLPAPVRLLVETAAGAAVYAGLLHSFSVEAYADFMQEARRRLMGTALQP